MPSFFLVAVVAVLAAAGSAGSGVAGSSTYETVRVKYGIPRTRRTLLILDVRCSRSRVRPEAVEPIGARLSPARGYAIIEN